MLPLLQLPVMKVCISMLSGHRLFLALCIFTPHPLFFLGANKQNVRGCLLLRVSTRAPMHDATLTSLAGRIYNPHGKWSSTTHVI